MNNNHTLAFLLDVDGVIVDTPHERAWRDSSLQWNLISEDFDFKSFYQKYVAGIAGLKGAENILEQTLYYENFGIISQEEKEKFARELRASKQQYLDRYIHNGEFHLFEDVLQIINGLKTEEIPMAVVSASENAERILKKSGIYDLFDSATLGAISHRAEKKEHLYSFAFGRLCGKLGFDLPPTPVVLEDADKAIESVKNLGYVCIGIARANLTTPSSLIGIGADLAYDGATLIEKGHLGILQDLKNLTPLPS